ncbi:hypothetical protein EMCRGX_G017011 [Ephydatia muelleri]
MARRVETSDHRVTGQAASDAIRACIVDLLEPITFGTTIDKLYAKELIDGEIYEEVTRQSLTTQDKGRKILCEVQKKVKARPMLFDTFCEILCSNEATSDISQRLRSDVLRMATKDATPQLISTTTLPDSKSEECIELVELKETRQKDRKLIYVAFKSEPRVSVWSEKCAFEEGIQKQRDDIPTRFFVEQLKDEWEIVLTGFSFGGMLACSVAASIWNLSAITPEEFKRRVVCITFGQPLISIPYVEDIIKTSHEFQESIHLIFDQNDVIPRLLRFASSSTTQLSACSEKIENKTSATAVRLEAFQQTTVSVCLRNLGILQDQERATYSNVVVKSVTESRRLALTDLQHALKAAVPVVTGQDAGSPLLLAYCYIISQDKQLIVIDKSKAFDALSFFGPSSIDNLSEDLFKQHNMESFTIKTAKIIENTVQQVPEVGVLKPRVEGVAFHCYGSSEVAVVVLGDQLWFCYEIHLGEGNECRKISTPAQHVTRKSIQFNYTPSEKNDISTSCNKIKVTLHSRFYGPVGAVVDVKKKVYPCTLRQAQLAKHTPTEVIQLAYLSAMLEQPSYKNAKRDFSERFKTTTKFLEDAVRIVPIESIFYAIAYGDEDVALQCSKALEERKPSIPPSEMVIAASQYAATRVITGCHKEFIDHIDLQMRTMNIYLHGSLCFPMKVSIMPYPDNYLKITFQYDVPIPIPIPVHGQRAHKVSKVKDSLYSDVVVPRTRSVKLATSQSQIVPVRTAKVKSDITIPIPPKDDDSLHASPNLVEYLQKFAEDIYVRGCSKIARGEELVYTCGLNINEVYQTSSKSEFVLSSPTKVLSDARQELSVLVKLACEESKGIPLSISQEQSNDQGSPNLSSFHNLEMLKTINKVRAQELNLCTTLLSAFMEQQIRIPLINSSPLETASALSTSEAPIAVGVWALFSLNYGDIKEMLVSLRGKPLMVDITNYIMGIFNSPLKMEDARYAGKLQFLLQGMDETISCNSQYVSYSLERQLVDLCGKRLKTSINLSTDLEDIIAKWDTIFQGDALSLVAKPHRSLIARWLKWALMIHQLREKLAEYTAVGVIGLTNSGKSHLVNKLFGVQTLVGTTQMKRTTIPLMYSFNGTIKKLDVIDFPGVDDQDEKIHTQSARSWLTELESEKEAVPILVCLTHADRLYAEIMAQENGSKDKPELGKRYIRSELNLIKDRLGHSPSRDVDFYSFSQEPDSSLNNEKGRKTLKDVGIHRIKDVGVWIVEKLKTHLDQPDMANKLQEHFQKSTK